jgi:alkylation response protein AidB-like acyl-CoA dehydrogenase
MNFRLTDAQQMLVGTARELLRRRCPPELVHAMAEDPRGLPEDLWKELSMLGWPGLLIPAELGGSDGSLLDVILLVEEMGRAGLPGPFIPSAVVATSLLMTAGTQAQRDRLLSPMALGDRICTLALLEESAALEPQAIGMSGEVGSRVTGRKLFVKDAHLAHDLVVAVRGGGGINLFVVETGAAGIALSPMDVLSGEKLFEVAFSDVPVDGSRLIGPAGRGWDSLVPALRAGALARSAEMVGAAARLLDLAVEHARTRVQSGRPIGSFQAIQHHCADMLRHVDAARGLLHRAAWKMETGEECAADVAMAKAYAADGCLAVARRTHQVLGAIGYCEEHVLHRFHKRIQAGAVDFGEASLHLETVATAIGLV